MHFSLVSWQPLAKALLKAVAASRATEPACGWLLGTSESAAKSESALGTKDGEACQARNSESAASLSSEVGGSWLTQF